MKQNNFMFGSYQTQELSRKELREINGGFIELAVAATIIGIVAGLAYLYEFGYNIVDKAFARAQK